MSEEQKNREIPINIFYSYAQEDETFCRELEKHLGLLRQEGKIVEWSKRKLLAGDHSANELDQKLLSASLILLLISTDFLKSEYIDGTEVHRALERHNSGEARVIPVLLRPSGWQHTPLAHLKCLPNNAHPVTSWRDKDQAFQEIADEICHVVETMLAGATPSASFDDNSYSQKHDPVEKSRNGPPNVEDRLIYTYDLHANWSRSVTWSPDGLRIASAGLDNTVHVWQASTGKHLLIYRHPRGLLPNAVYIARWSSDSKYLASAGKSSTIHVWEAANARVVSTYQHSSIISAFSHIFHLSWSPDNRYIISCDMNLTEDGFHVWDALRGKQVMKLTPPLRLKLSSAGTVAWSPDGTRIAATWGRYLHIYHAETGKLIYTSEKLTDWLFHVAWLSDSRYLLFSEGFKVNLWDTVTMTTLYSYSAHSGYISEIALSQDGKYVGSASEDRTIHIWEPLTGRQRFVYRGHRDQVTSVTWSPDGTRIASASKDTSIHVWRTLLE